MGTINMLMTLRSFSLSLELGEDVQVLEQCLKAVMGWMKANKLKMNYDKTEVLWFGGSQV